jgi:hypothetical protein
MLHLLGVNHFTMICITGDKLDQNTKTLDP